MRVLTDGGSNIYRLLPMMKEVYYLNHTPFDFTSTSIDLEYADIVNYFTQYSTPNEYFMGRLCIICESNLKISFDYNLIFS